MKLIKHTAQPPPPTVYSLTDLTAKDLIVLRFALMGHPPNKDNHHFSEGEYHTIAATLHNDLRTMGWSDIPVPSEGTHEHE